MLHKPKFRRLTLLEALAVTIILLIVVGLSILGFAGVHNSRVNCLNIEALKTQVRADARNDFRNLDRNGRLLHIKITKEIRDTARQERDQKLKNYAAGSCKGFYSG